MSETKHLHICLRSNSVLGHVSCEWVFCALMRKWKVGNAEGAGAHDGGGPSSLLLLSSASLADKYFLNCIPSSSVSKAVQSIHSEPRRYSHRASIRNAGVEDKKRKNKNRKEEELLDTQF